MVGKEEVPSRGNIKGLRRFVGLSGPLKRNGYFRRAPQILKTLLFYLGCVAGLLIAGWMYLEMFTPEK